MQIALISWCGCCCVLWPDFNCRLWITAACAYVVDCILLSSTDLFAIWMHHVPSPIVKWVCAHFPSVCERRKTILNPWRWTENSVFFANSDVNWWTCNLPVLNLSSSSSAWKSVLPNKWRTKDVQLKTKSTITDKIRSTKDWRTFVVISNDVFVFISHSKWYQVWSG